MKNFSNFQSRYFFKKSIIENYLGSHSFRSVCDKLVNYYDIKMIKLYEIFKFFYLYMIKSYQVDEKI